MKGNLECMFEEYKARGILTLKLPVRKSLTDHIISCPEIFRKAMAPKTTKKGCIVNGMIDKKTELYPDIYKILNTCKQEVKNKQVELFFTHFSELYSVMKRDGHITEDIYDRIGFRKDTNYAGKNVLKPDRIFNKMRHQAKILR